ncbi:MAG: hypothetical protein GY886_01325, partial [Gammaproteobacteria bacterium]|nr:hypothetical protein [Gammaproteobacteria bacterium]
MNRYIAFLATVFFTMSLMLNAQDLAQDLGVFQQIETETLDGEDFIFPDGLRAKRLNIVLLALSEDQDNGTWQGEALVDWYAALEAKGILSEDVLAWHFSFMKVPFFVKSFVRGGMADDYAGKIPLDQAGPVFIKDVPGFAAEAGIAMDGQPSIVLVSPDGQLLQLFKGEVTDENL